MAYPEASLLDENAPRRRPTAVTRAGLRIKRCGPGEAKVLDRTGREIAQLVREPSGRRWRVAMAPAVVRTLSSSDPTFDSQHAALSWLADVQFDR